MAVSYLSTPLESSPYVLPLDLGLFSNVMSIKQKKIDDNVSAVQAGIDQLGLLDVMKDEDKNYLNEKINGLVGSINNLGGVDFSDSNIMRQIEGLGSDIYGDSNIITALSSTKAIRNLQNSYEKYKSDPKLNKLYSEVNEAYDMQNVQSYLSDKKVGSKYSGPTSATPYTAYRDNHLKAFDKIVADQRMILQDNGLYYSSETNKYIHPERVMNMAADLLTPQERAQMKRDGWYLYRGAAPEQLLQKGLQQFTAKKQDAKAILKQYETMAAAAVSDPQARTRYTTLADEQAKILSAIQSAEGDYVNSFTKRLTDNPEELYYELYSNDYFRGLGNRFSFNQTTRGIIPNTAEMFRQKMNQADQQFKDTLGLNERKFAFEQQKHEDEMALEYLKVGKYRKVDPISGNVEVLDIPDYHLYTDTPNTENPDGLKVTEKTLIDVNSELKIENDKLSQDFISRAIALHPELGEELNSNIGKGITRKFKGQNLLEDFNGIKGFQIDDLKMFETSKDEKGNPRYKYDMLVQKYGHVAGLDSKKLEFFANQWKNYESLALGKTQGLPDLVDGFPDVMEKITLNNEKISANNQKLESVKRDVYKDLGLNQQQIQFVENNYYKNKSASKDLLKGAIDFIVENWPSQGNFRDKQIINKIKNETQKKLDVLSTRDVYGIRTLSEKEPSYKELSSLISQDIQDNKSEPYGDNPSVNSDEIGSIEPRMIGKASDGSGRWMVLSDVIVGSGDKKAVVKYKTFLSDENAAKFNLERDRYEAINYSVAVNGRTGDIPVYGSKDLAAFVTVAAYNTNDLNDRSSFTQVKVYNLDENGQKTGRYSTIKIPGTEGRTPSESFQRAKEAIEKAAKLGLTHKDFIDYLTNYK